MNLKILDAHQLTFKNMGWRMDHFKRKPMLGIDNGNSSFSDLFEFLSFICLD